MFLHEEQHAGLCDEEFQDEIGGCRTNLDVVAIYKILIDHQQLFDQYGVPRTAGSVENGRHEMFHGIRLAYIMLMLLTHVKL